MKKLIIYIHGQGGNIEEADHYRPLFKEYDVVGMDYHSEYPWQAEEEFVQLYESLSEGYDSVTLVANSIGAYFALSSLKEKNIEEAYLISPVTDMKKLIEDMMMWANVTEEELKEKGEIETSFGNTLSYDYLVYARNHPVSWKIRTHILYGEKDHLTSLDTIRGFAEKIDATLTVMKDGEHWFHTEEEMDFLDRWILSVCR